MAFITGLSDLKESAHYSLRGRPHTQDQHKVDPWMLDDKLVREFLLKIYPKLQENTAQRERAGLMARLIIGWRFFSAGDLAHQLGWDNPDRVHVAIQRIKRRYKGLTARKGLTPKKRGRPKKIVLG